ncbi:ROK family protein [Niabella hibiscisoli]|uniref:ROK family protein n=1 Tax=Niabella hibiscisoli TaxID=1825928 RepID=UPI001F0EF8F8|nr:ROK family protein [Niabella hibiscisoli]MCH5717699.1 ROK family protein [Niabella hibiscisoli]
MRLAIVDNNFNIVTPIKTIALHLGNSRKDFCGNILKSVRSLLSAVKIPRERIIGCSIGMPGLISQGLGENYTYLLDQTEQSLQQDLEAVLQLPVILQNDVKGAALAELRYGLAKGKQNVLVLLMDWGVGLGIIMDGEIRQGSWGFSGEIGHIPFIEHGELCYCGKRGCLETVASGLALSKIARKDISSGTTSILGNLSKKDIQELAPSHIIDAANKGDQYAIQLLSDIGANIGKGTSTLIQLFNPELIILSGKIAEAKQYITLPMQQAINTYCMTQVREKTKIISSNHPEHFRIFGYAANAVESF